MPASDYLSPPWWVRLDREAEFRAAHRRLQTGGGVLVFRGKDDNGRHEAAVSIVARLRETASVSRLGVGRDSSAGGLRGVVRAAWADLEAAGNPTLGPSVLLSAEPLRTLCSEFATRLRQASGLTIVVLEDVENGGALDSAAIDALRLLGEGGALILVTSRAENRTNWDAGPAPVPRVELDSFVKAEVVTHLRAWLQSSSLEDDEQANVLSSTQKLMAAGRERIAPKTAYEILSLVDLMYQDPGIGRR